MKILTIDIGGSGEEIPRKFESGPSLTAKKRVVGVKVITKDWNYDVVSLGYSGPVLRSRPVLEPHNLGGGWVGFDYQRAFGKPVKIINDAAMQALGSYKKGKMLFLGLATGLGTCMVVDGIVEPMELGKVLAQHIIPELESKSEPKLGHDSSTNNLIRRYRKQREITL